MQYSSHRPLNFSTLSWLASFDTVKTVVAEALVHRALAV
jgi:hypothetical protein